jgi:hypothetical protein
VVAPILLGNYTLLHPVVKRPHRPAFPHDLGRHALADFALGTAIFNERFGRPGKHVDEAGRDGHSLDVDHGGRAFRREVADAGNAIAANGNIGHAWFVAGAVVNSPAFDNDVELLGRLRFRTAHSRESERKEKGGEDYGAEKMAAIIHK